MYARVRATIIAVQRKARPAPETRLQDAKAGGRGEQPIAMRLTQHTDFSIRVLIHLGVHPERRCTVREIADSYGISRNHLMKVGQKLVTAGFVDSVRGAGGGLTLAKPPEAINLGDVVRAMEPDFGMVECMRPDNACVITPACTLPPVLAEATRAYLEVISRYTLADLLVDDYGDRIRLLLSPA
jgi:Rrf2 family nitric oxide-sensitive transcriptional repressor